MRREAKARLAGCDPALGDAVARRIAPMLPPGCTVAGFHPIGAELDLRPFLHMLRDRGHVVALPRTPPLGEPLRFHRWGEGDALLPEPFGTVTSGGPPVVPDVLLVPLLAFDRRGYRLGYGGGYYDRTIAAMPGARTIGCAYAALEVPSVPVEPTDMKLEVIATEHELIRIG